VGVKVRDYFDLVIVVRSHTGSVQYDAAHMGSFEMEAQYEAKATTDAFDRQKLAHSYGHFPCMWNSKDVLVEEVIVAGDAHLVRYKVVYCRHMIGS
jgi:hypothetical protein